MKKIIAASLFACVCVGLVLAHSIKATFHAPFNDPTDVAAIKQIEQDIGDAMVAVDIDKLNQIFADDWATITSSGKVIAKEKLLQDFKSGKDKLVSYESGPIDAQVLGNFAVCHGSVIEKRIRDGKDISGESVWMDLLEKRAGKWVVVRTEGATVK
jgi:hypothetical protein